MTVVGADDIAPPLDHIPAGTACVLVLQLRPIRRRDHLGPMRGIHLRHRQRAGIPGAAQGEPFRPDGEHSRLNQIEDELGPGSVSRLADVENRLPQLLENRPGAPERARLGAWWRVAEWLGFYYFASARKPAAGNSIGGWQRPTSS